MRDKADIVSKLEASRTGFTIVEIMVVVAIIALLTAIAMPSLTKSRNKTQASAIAEDFRVFRDALQLYALNNRGGFPPSDWVEGAFPSGMEDEMPDAWIRETPVGGYYVFHNPGGAIEPLILLNRRDLPSEIMTMVDEMLDDGNLTTGYVRGDEGSLDFTIQ